MDRLNPALITVALLLGVAPALWYEMKARERLSAEGEKHPWQWGGPQDFTEEGWRFHVRATRLGALGLVLVILLGILFIR
jgi:hypothetical protein